MNQIEQAREALRNAHRVFVITGAGVSAESGVPTFRGVGGVWKNIDPYKVATPEAFAEDPAFVWQWYDDRRQNLLNLKPNPAHVALAQLESQVDDFFLLTQNVDDLHEQAGSKSIAHIHGSIWEVRCTREETVQTDRRAPLPELPPRCVTCGALLRPNVVWFGETINLDAVNQAESFLLTGDIDAVIVVGTEALFPYIIHWAQSARSERGPLIEINIGETILSPYADIRLDGEAGKILPNLV
ncbi:MAG: NAD-dependent deacylase [Candidatus Hinthialibacter antarcticus]|nr:NAD-dependent deacylase [Candidatus Hinthialibacter antarcticus]